jgi:hypothetical protein
MLMFKKLFVSVIAMGVYFSAVAQNIEGVNARLDGMGGIGTISDIGWTIDKPSALYGYGDHVQASAVLKDIEDVGKSFGAIIAIKSIGERIFLGMTFNSRSAMPYSFYDKFAVGFAGFDDLALKNGNFFPDIPRVNLGFKIGDNFTGGIGTFMEVNKREADNECEYRYTHTGGTNTVKYDSTYDQKYFGIGFNVDARIWTGPIKINPEFRVFIPKLERTHKTTLVDQVLATGHDIEADGIIRQINDASANTDLGENLFLRMGSKVSGTIQERLFWIVGYWYKNIKYKFTRDETFDSLVTASGAADTYGTQTVSRETWNINTGYNDLWIGLQPLFSDDLILGLEYSGSLEKYTPSNDNFTMDSTWFKVKHTFRFGAERSVKGFWCFEEFCPRFGLKYTLSSDLLKVDKNFNPADSTYINEYADNPWSSNFKKGDSDPSNGKGLKISAGLGLKGKRGTFDVSLEILMWAEFSALTGPNAAIASYTLDFGRKD